MRTMRAAVCLIGIAAWAAMPGMGFAQEGKPKPAVKAEAPPETETPKPGPHHLHLAKAAGTWDATVEFFGPPGTPPQVSKGVEVNTLDSGGLWLVTDFKGLWQGLPFHGHGLLGFDPAKGRYTSVWTDSMSPAMMVSEGGCDGSGRIRTMTSAGQDMEGKPTTWRMISEDKDANTRIFTMSAPGPDGKDQVAMKITYKRRA